MNIYLLKRKGSKGLSSLYLVYYFSSKKRSSEFLKLYIYTSPKTQLERQHNKQIMTLANTIVSQKKIDLQYNQHGLISPLHGKIGLLVYFKKVMAEKKNSLSSYHSWKSAFLHLEKFLDGKDVTFDQVNDTLLEGFKKYLLTIKICKGRKCLSQNSAASYFSKLKETLKDAYLKRHTKYDLGARIKMIKNEETHREYLTAEELAKLYHTECEIPELRIAFLFGCYTGLRHSDIKVLEWSQFSFTDSLGWQLTFTQKKTKGAETLPIAYEAIQLLYQFEHREGKIFKELVYSAWMNGKLKDWFLKAGITKHLTFHSSRHTFATLSLSMNTDLYTISKLLGHKNIKTTQVYAKILNPRLIEAVANLSKILN